MPTATQGTLNQPLRGQPPAGQTGIAGPPGYQQNPYAGNSNNSGYGGYGYNSQPGNSSTQSEEQGGILGNIGSAISGVMGTGSGSSGGPGSILGGGGSGEGESIMSAVGSWAQGVGKKAAELEGEVWKRVNGEK